MTLTDEPPALPDYPEASSAAARPRPRIQLSATQILASALAAVTATIAASYLGVSGTVIGAALASVVTVIGNAVYGHSIHRTRERVRTVVLPGARPVPAAPVDAGAAVRDPARSRAVTLRRLGFGFLAVFAVLNVVITGVELAAGRPISDLLRGRHGSGTTLFGGAHPTVTVPRLSTVRPVQPTVTVTASVVVQTPTVTRTAAPVTATVTPTVTVSARPSAPAATPTPPPTTSPSATPAP